MDINKNRGGLDHPGSLFKKLFRIRLVRLGFESQCDWKSDSFYDGAER